MLDVRCFAINRTKKQRVFAGAVLSLVVFPLLVSCLRTDYTATDLLTELISVIDEPPEMNICFKNGDGLNAVAQGELSDLFDGVDPSTSASDFAFFRSKRDRLYEIYVFCAPSADRSELLCDILERRIELIQTRDIRLYDEDWYERAIAPAKILVRGRYVILLVTPCNGKIEKKLNSIL